MPSRLLINYVLVTLSEMAASVPFHICCDCLVKWFVVLDVAVDANSTILGFFGKTDDDYDDSIDV